jgi:plastocyanin
MGPRPLALIVLGMMACAMPLAAETIRVTIDNLKFSPAEVSAHVGDTIEWVSSDFVAHTATASNKDWESPSPRRGPVGSRCSMLARSVISVAFIRI